MKIMNILKSINSYSREIDIFLKKDEFLRDYCRGIVVYDEFYWGIVKSRKKLKYAFDMEGLLGNKEMNYAHKYLEVYRGEEITLVFAEDHLGFVFLNFMEVK